MIEFTKLGAVPFRGGAITVREKESLSFGSYSMVANMRGDHPGFHQRKGQIALHTSADGTNSVLSLYQFVKNRISETTFLVQMSDGDILKATNQPPSVTTGAFGEEVFSGSSGQIPASWGHTNDILIHSNGVDQHKVFVGNDNYVEKCIVYSGTATLTLLPQAGTEYTDEVIDGQTSTVAIFDSLGTDADQCVFICCPVRANRLTFTVAAANGNSVTVTVSYMKNTNAWTTTSATDGTASGGATLAQTGSMYWTPPSDEIPFYQYGICGFWYRLTFSAALDSEVEISKITYGTDGSGSGTRTSFLDLVNTWDGLPVDPPEIRVSHDSLVYTYPAGVVTLGLLDTTPFDANDTLDIPSADLLCGAYIDVGSTPNTGAATAIDEVKYWTGTAWRGIVADDSLSIFDGTVGLTKSGWVLWPRPTYEPQPLQIEGSFYNAFWYRLEVNGEVSSDVIVSIRTMPYFDIEEMGKGLCNCSWGESMAYSFTLWPNYIYVTDKNRPGVLNGRNYGILVAGDGRTNRVRALRDYYNELIAFQEEVGVEGGTITLFEGDNPDNYGKLILSSEIGTMNNNTVVVADGVLTSTATEEKVKKVIFFLSKRAGLCACDGQNIVVVSDDIQNYFDPTKSECIRRGYEDKHWLAYDSAENVLRLGLVSGSSATAPNVFPVFDLTDRVFYFDTPGQSLTCATEVDAGSGNIPTIQVGGGSGDGLVYQLNTTTNDVSSAIDSYITTELSGEGEKLLTREILLICKAQSAGNITLTATKNDLAGFTKTLPMTADYTGRRYRRHRFSSRLIDMHISLKFENNVASQEMELISWGVRSYKLENR